MFLRGLRSNFGQFLQFDNSVHVSVINCTVITESVRTEGSRQFSNAAVF